MMTSGTPNIFHTDIVPADNDVYWDEPNDLLPDTDHRHVLVITKHYESGSNEELVLNNLLGACKLSAAQYHLLKLRENKVAWYQLRTCFQPGIVLLIGILPSQIAVSALFGLNDVNRYDGCLWVPSLSIAEMEVHKEMKTQLWANALKPLFVEKKFEDQETR